MSFLEKVKKLLRLARSRPGAYEATAPSGVRRATGDARAGRQLATKRDAAGLPCAPGRDPRRRSMSVLARCPETCPRSDYSNRPHPPEHSGLWFRMAP